MVTSGVYAYVANPMQLSMQLLLTALALWLWSPFFAMGAGLNLIYSAGFAWWSEGGDLAQRFGPRWAVYRRQVRAWRPRWRPFVETARPATLYYDDDCAMCTALKIRLEALGPTGLRFAFARDYPGAAPRRLTYRGADGYQAIGVRALARALEHIHLGFALFAFALRLPVIAELAQRIGDAAGAGPRPAGESKSDSGN